MCVCRVRSDVVQVSNEVAYMVYSNIFLLVPYIFFTFMVAMQVFFHKNLVDDNEILVGLVTIDFLVQLSPYVKSIRITFF